MAKESLIADRALQFSLDVIRLIKRLDKTYENIVFIRQILRSATSIGANIEEALGGSTKKEFIQSMNIAKKEARETAYWLKLIAAVNTEIHFESLVQENNELISILTSIVKTSKANLVA